MHCSACSSQTQYHLPMLLLVVIIIAGLQVHFGALNFSWKHCNKNKGMRSYIAVHYSPPFNVHEKQAIPAWYIETSPLAFISNFYSTTRRGNVFSSSFMVLWTPHSRDLALMEAFQCMFCYKEAFFIVWPPDVSASYSIFCWSSFRSGSSFRRRLTTSMSWTM